MTRKTLNPYLKKALKEQMFCPIKKCEMHQAFCRFAIPSYCLEEHKRFACEFASAGMRDIVTFKEKK